MENEGERPVLFKIFIKFLDDGIERTLSNAADDIKEEGVFDTLYGHAAVQRDLNCVQKWVNRNLMKFTEEMQKPVPGKEQSPASVHRLAGKQLGIMDLGILVAKLSISQQCTLAVSTVIQAHSGP